MDIRGKSAPGSGRRASSHPLVGLLVVGLLVAAGCSNRGDDTSSSAPPVTAAATTAPTAGTEPPDSAAPTGSDATTPGSEAPSTDATTAPATEPPVTEAPGITFGDMASPCGPGNATIAEGQNGGKKLVLATATDKGAEVAPGLDKEMYDAAIAFAKWCNEQGGIAGLEIDVLDADGKLFSVPAAMEEICSQAFAMVGGGLVFDDQEFPRFHECGMIDIAGYTVTTAKAMSNGMVQPIPNPVDTKNAMWFQWAKENHPEDLERFATLYADVLTTQIVEQQAVETMGVVGGYNIVDRIPYSPTGEANWAPFAQRLKDKQITGITFVGAPETFTPFLTALDEIGYRPNLILQEGNFYAPVVIDRAGKAAEGIVIRTNYAPFEEADSHKAIADFQDMMETYNPDGKVGGLSLQTISAYLLFATAANACLADNDNVLERECILAHAKQIHEWTGGGLHSLSDPGNRTPPACSVMLVIRDGEFQRLYPELGSADDSGDGFHCDPAELVTLTGDYGDPTAGIDPDRPN